MPRLLIRWKSFWLGVLVIGFLGCASPKVGVSEEEMNAGKGKVGPWSNIYRGDPSLAGVSVQQFPDGDDGFSFEERNGKHPSMIVYGFWDGRFRQLQYAPSGKATGDSWFKIDNSTLWIWGTLDFTQGSDPAFKSHQDPRVRSSSSRKSVAD